MTDMARPERSGERGYAMVALLVLMAVMAVAMTVALPAWSTLARREKEAELVFRGEQYARAIMLFQRKSAGAFPPSIDVLVNERFLRKRFKDPITNDEFKTIAVGEAVSQAQTANPLARGGLGTGAPAPAARGAGPAGAAPQSPPNGGRGTFVLGGNQGGVRGAGVGAGGGAGIMGVTSKSTEMSIRQYKGADRYDQWLFIATDASNQAGGRGGRSPGEGVRGNPTPGPQGTRGGPGGRGQPPTLPGAPFGASPFGRGQQPQSPAAGRGRF
jgi:type II secretory pathway pseudopilin PulG